MTNSDYTYLYLIRIYIYKCSSLHCLLQIKTAQKTLYFITILLFLVCILKLQLVTFFCLSVISHLIFFSLYASPHYIFLASFSKSCINSRSFCSLKSVLLIPLSGEIFSLTCLTVLLTLSRISFHLLVAV